MAVAKVASVEPVFSAGTSSGSTMAEPTPTLMAKSAISAGAAESKPTTSIIPASSGSAMVKLLAQGLGRVDRAGPRFGVRENHEHVHGDLLFEGLQYREGAVGAAKVQALGLANGVDYSAFVQGVVDKSNRRVQGKLDVERPYLRSLPQAAVPEYTTWRTKVKKWSTIRVTNKTYSVPSRLCGHEVKVHQYADYLEVYYKDHMVERLERVRGEHKSRIDYRHIIWSLVRKPGAFARYRFREHLFPTPVKRKPTMPWAVGMVDGRMWSTSASCTWQPAPWRPEWSGLSPSSF